MTINSSDIKELLARENMQFRRLKETHQSYEQRLLQLNKSPYLTAEEEREIAELKKKKLSLKDQMHIMMTAYRAQQS